MAGWLQGRQGERAKDAALSSGCSCLGDSGFLSSNLAAQTKKEAVRGQGCSLGVPVFTHWPCCFLPKNEGIFQSYEEARLNQVESLGFF